MNDGKNTAKSAGVPASNLLPCCVTAITRIASSSVATKTSLQHGAVRTMLRDIAARNT